MPTLAEFKAAFPELVFSADNSNGYTDAEIEAALEDVAAYAPASGRAALYAVAHWLTYDSPGGEITSESSQVGESVTRRPTSRTPDEAFWGGTQYGVKFLALARRRGAYTARFV